MELVTFALVLLTLFAAVTKRLSVFEAVAIVFGIVVIAHLLGWVHVQT